MKSTHHGKIPYIPSFISVTSITEYNNKLFHLTLIIRNRGNSGVHVSRIRSDRAKAVLKTLEILLYIVKSYQEMMELRWPMNNYR